MGAREGGGGGGAHERQNVLGWPLPSPERQVGSEGPHSRRPRGHQVLIKAPGGLCSHHDHEPQCCLHPHLPGPHPPLALTCGTKPVTRLYRSSRSTTPLTRTSPLRRPFCALPASTFRRVVLPAAAMDGATRLAHSLAVGGCPVPESPPKDCCCGSKFPSHDNLTTPFNTPELPLQPGPAHLPRRDP